MSTPTPLTDRYMDRVALEAYAGVSKGTVQDWLAHPEHPLPHYRVDGGKILVRQSEFDAWISQWRIVGSATADRIAQTLQVNGLAG
jgi:excisionase family DNA binding protein